MTRRRRWTTALGETALMLAVFSLVTEGIRLLRGRPFDPGTLLELALYAAFAFPLMLEQSKRRAEDSYHKLVASWRRERFATRKQKRQK